MSHLRTKVVRSGARGTKVVRSGTGGTNMVRGGAEGTAVVQRWREEMRTAQLAYVHSGARFALRWLASHGEGGTTVPRRTTKVRGGDEG